MPEMIVLWDIVSLQKNENSHPVKTRLTVLVQFLELNANARTRHVSKLAS